jgi:hypothetical protein
VRNISYLVVLSGSIQIICEPLIKNPVEDEEEYPQVKTLFNIDQTFGSAMAKTPTAGKRYNEARF